MKKKRISVLKYSLYYIGQWFINKYFNFEFQDEAKAKLGQAQVGRRPTKQVHGTLPTTLTKTIPISSALPVTQNQQIIINSDGSATNAVPISGSISIPVSQEKVLIRLIRVLNLNVCQISCELKIKDLLFWTYFGHHDLGWPRMIFFVCQSVTYWVEWVIFQPFWV